MKKRLQSRNENNREVAVQWVVCTGGNGRKDRRTEPSQVVGSYKEDMSYARKLEQKSM